MASKPKPKKTVSFSGIEYPKQSNEKEQLYSPFNLKIVPMHFILIGLSILQQDLSPSNVVSNLLFHLYTLIAAQVAYTLLFIPNFLESKKKKVKSIKFNITQDYNVLFIGLLAALILIIPIFVIVILFGAPFSTYFQENLLLSAHLSFLSYPIIISFLKLGDHGIFYKYLISIAIGAWFGAVVIPLDWDRPWQNWPLPIVVSSYIGSFLGYTFVGLLSSSGT